MTDFHLAELSLEHETAFMDAGLVSLEQSVVVPRTVTSPTEFRKFVRESQKQRLDWRPGPNKQSITRYAMLDPAGRICAMGLMRFPLDDKSDEGGNLQCEVPSALRERGYGSMCLALLLFEAVRAGLRRALVTCDADNAAARRVIEKNRGELDEVVPRPGKTALARYWIRFSV